MQNRHFQDRCQTWDSADPVGDDEAYHVFFIRMKNMVEIDKVGIVSKSDTATITDILLAECGFVDEEQVVLPDDFSPEDFAVLYILDVIMRFLPMFVRRAKITERGLMIGDALIQLGPAAITGPILQKFFDIAGVSVLEDPES